MQVDCSAFLLIYCKAMSDSYAAPSFVLGGRAGGLDARPGQAHGAHVMGILNVTPDSFSDGGRYVSVEAAVSRAAAMLSNGAAIIDIGGESTRPGADPVSAGEEADRVVPVVEALHERFPDARLSIDTYKPSVAAAALEAGAHIINDVTGLRLHPEMAAVVAAHDAALIVMHSVGTPGGLTAPQRYDDVVDAVRDGLASAIARADAAGVQHIAIDPGFGFGKTTRDNLRLMHAVDTFVALGRPVLVGVSRKSSIGKALGTEDEPVPVAERLFGTLGATAVAVQRGAGLVRTHDVAATVDFLRVLGQTLVSGEA